MAIQADVSQLREENVQLRTEMRETFREKGIEILDLRSDMSTLTMQLYGIIFFVLFLQLLTYGSLQQNLHEN